MSNNTSIATTTAGIVTAVVVGLASIVAYSLVAVAPGHQVSRGFFGDVVIRDARGRYISSDQAAANGLAHVVTTVWDYFAG